MYKVYVLIDVCNVDLMHALNIMLYTIDIGGKRTISETLTQTFV